MPDSWEYPFFAAWDTAFHCPTLAMIDPEFAKKQLDLMTREWYMVSSSSPNSLQANLQATRSVRLYYAPEHIVQPLVAPRGEVADKRNSAAS